MKPLLAVALLAALCSYSGEIEAECHQLSFDARDQLIDWVSTCYGVATRFTNSFGGFPIAETDGESPTSTRGVVETAGSPISRNWKVSSERIEVTFHRPGQGNPHNKTVMINLTAGWET